jgi:Rrf2 family nitric oxide-sensitive transcriptional repressor
MKLTNFTDYSLRTLIYLASSDKELCTAREISECFNISWNHTVRVVHGLSKNGYVIGKKGKGGGITLAKNINEIIIGKVVRDVETNFNIVECLEPKNNNCIISPACILKNVILNARQAFLNELDKYTLLDIVKNKAALKRLIKHQ